MTLCVLDASVALAWAFEDEASPYADGVIEALKETHALVPLIWPLEVNNAMVLGVGRRRFQETDAFRFLNVLDSLPLAIDNEIARHELGSRLLRLELTYGLSSYDASYLALAIRRGLPLATQDRRLRDAAGAAGVPFFQP